MFFIYKYLPDDKHYNKDDFIVSMQVNQLWCFLLSFSFPLLDIHAACLYNDLISGKERDPKMGIYLNPPADGFTDILKDGFYVDKTGLITYTNQVMGTSRKLTCFSRPRRFGKSYAAQMLVAFYSKGADSRHLFYGLRSACPPEETSGSVSMV